MSITNPFVFNYLKANLKNETTIESIESVIEKSTIYTNHLITKDSFTK
jgi:hypothetical protein